MIDRYTWWFTRSSSSRMNKQLRCCYLRRHRSYKVTETRPHVVRSSFETIVISRTSDPFQSMKEDPSIQASKLMISQVVPSRYRPHRDRPIRDLEEEAERIGGITRRANDEKRNEKENAVRRSAVQCGREEARRRAVCRTYLGATLASNCV